MGKRQSFTEAQLSRAVKVADKHGKVAVQTHLGIAFVAREDIQQSTSTETAVDDWFRQNDQDPREGH